MLNAESVLERKVILFFLLGMKALHEVCCSYVLYRYLSLLDFLSQNVDLF